MNREFYLDSAFNIETDRLILRSFTEMDLNQHVAILSNWEVTKWLSSNIPFPYSLEEGKKFIAEAKANYNESDNISLSVIHKETSNHIGGVRVFSYLKEECEVGYWIDPEHWGKGYATEFLKAVCEWIFSVGVTKKIIAQTAKDNIGSRRILEKQGFLHKGSPPSQYARCGHGSGCSEFYTLEKKEPKE